MEALVERGRLLLALRRVVANKGASGVAGVVVSERKDHLNRRWPVIRVRPLADEPLPMAVRGVDIPEPQGGVRTLGIPTVVDIDLEKFFDRVNHDLPMGKVGQTVGDARVLKPIRRYLEAVVTTDGCSRDSKGRLEAARGPRCCPTSC